MNASPTCDLDAISSVGVEEEERNADGQCANIPFRPLREKDAAKLVLYGVLSLLKRTLVGGRQ